MRLIIVSGLSGSGKSVALHMLEDLGFYCIDNLPAGLIGHVIEHALLPGQSHYRKFALGVDARNRADELAGVPTLAEQLRQRGVETELIFVHAKTGVLLTRYSETRRRHPLSDDTGGLRDAIRTEKKMLEPIADAADLVIDTSRTSVHQLRELIRQRVDQRESGRMSLMFQSFGYKHGIPRDSDFLFDCRCLPNPYWETSLRKKSGLDQDVAEFLADHQDVADMTADIEAYLRRWLPEFARENRNYLTVAIGCTGGQHRSVFLCEQLADRFRDEYPNVMTIHNELRDS